MKPQDSQAELKLLDMTPDEELPVRILQAYREECDALYAGNTAAGAPLPLIRRLNDDNQKRAKILDRALARLTGAI